MQIIYTPDTDQFRTEPDKDFSHLRANPVSRPKLKSNYDKLKSKIEIPSNVGIVTFPFYMRSLCGLVPLVEGSATNYRLLAIFEKILELEKEPQDSFIDTEYVYRQIGVFMSPPSVTLDDRFFWLCSFA